MQKMVTVNEAASILGISTQGVHYRIKKNQLKSTKKQGRVFVYVDINEKENKSNQEINEIIKLKDEQINLLKDNIIHIKKQYKNEIKRLEKIQYQTIKLFKGEIELLKGAFVELKKVYQIEHKQKNVSYLSLKEFITMLQQKGVDNKKIKSIIVDRIKNKDDRFLFDEQNKEILVIKTDFSDLWQYA